MCAPYRALLSVGRRLGRRGAFLLCMGLAWINYGAALLLTPTPPAQVNGLTILSSIIPLPAWGWVWLLSGCVGVALCGVRVVGADQAGFTALVFPAATWATGYFADWVVIGDYSRGWVVAGTYGALAAAIYIASGWPEVRRTGRVRRE